MKSSFAATSAKARTSSLGKAWLWCRKNLFGGLFSTVVTCVIAVLVLSVLPSAFNWAIRNAVFAPDSAACRAAAEHGACWGVIAAKYRIVLFGRYPFPEQWRPLIVTIALVLLLVLSCWRRMWHAKLLVIWSVTLLSAFFMLRGGLFGLEPVETERWGGLPLTMLLSMVSLGLSFPLAVMIALGRRSRMPIIKALCVLFVEIVRGVPLISVLFMASFMFPLLLPQGMSIDVLVRVLVGLTLFTGAYLAEAVRAGLQAIPKGQVEAACAIGLSTWQTNSKIVLPQALRLVVPSMMNTLIGTFKDTSLVTIVGLFELTGSLQLSLADAEWRRFYIEGQLFVAAIYFVFCFSMSRYSRWIEHHLNRGTRRQ
ncbi:amino acid ABC transporter permease [Glaciimonas sp. CA11.2]|uniref:amino acid ABC transporter permease n=2 Tax=unclassified Glaciimonas TaxID=2644401 RepID=UPI002AB3A78B|nr:amino acid ABC transporter permease [Glaciimonas sp. CA11.2]MDY7547602.1 amino acid ABC transporter permease [Glaciimonas sp. CA11.2]MEB0162460.1 amino acid ABC transporter permease [Glaciimonas sp. CA11.2]